jgi:outer membrane protein W
MRTSALFAAAALLLGASAPASAQRAEVSAFVGWTLADGVSGDTIESGDGSRYNRVDPKDSASWGLGIGIFTNENAEVGFLFGQQKTELDAKGTNTRKIDDLTINSYHPYFAYNFGDGSARVRPYIMIGIGATSYSDLSYVAPLTGEMRTVSGETRLSTTWGGGIKAYASDAVGLRLGFQWTPTYIKSDSAGWWCDPFWGCYVVGDAQYANQFQMSGGLTVRF